MTPLREVVGDLAFIHLKERYPLVVDALALREAGVGAETRVRIQPLTADDRTPPWEAYGLVALPARSAILLTTVAGPGATLREPLSEALEQALAAAVARGQDSSGRFRSALNWLRPENVAAAVPPAPRMPGLGADSTDWIAWEPVAGLSDDTLIVVRRDLVAGVGLALVLFLALFFWSLRRRSSRWRLTFLFLTLGLAGLGVLWLPASLRLWRGGRCSRAALVRWRGTGVPSRAGRRSPRAGADRRKASRPARPRRAHSCSPSSAGAVGPPRPAPVTVYLVPGPAESPENQTVLVPADFLDRLKTLARPAPLVAGGPRVVLLDAAYEGKLVDGDAEFAAVFAVQCLTDEAATLAIPLDGVQLVGDVWLDGRGPIRWRCPHCGLVIPSWCAAAAGTRSNCASASR